MSEQKMKGNLEQFLQMAAQDPELQKKLKAASDRDAYVRSVVKLGKEKGYEFTSDRVETVLDNAVREAGSNEESVVRLSEAELMSVAGGRDPQPEWSQQQTCPAANNPFCNPDARRRRRKRKRRRALSNAGRIINAAF